MPDEDVPENRIARQIVDAAIEVHRTLGGPGLLEAIYEEALCWELEQRGLSARRQICVAMKYKDHAIATPLRVDLLVDDVVIVEVKATTGYTPIFESQALTYLRVTGLRLALVINFGERFVRDGIHRVVNHL